ncbi:MAG: glycosyltransferase family 4 protein [Gammaproteobacteria bacterium]
MKILLLNYEYPPLGGGAANATAYLLKEFIDQPGISIDLVTSSVGEEHFEQLGTNIRIYYLDIGKRTNIHYQSMKDLLKYAFKASKFSKQLCAKTQYDLCHAFFGIPCGFMARRLGLPYIVSLRGSDVPFYNERFKLLDTLVFQRLSIGIWRDAKAVVANSEGLRLLALESSPQQKIDIIKNGVDIDEFYPAERSGTVLRVLCVSRLIERKGIDFLIRAVSQLPEKQVQLTIVGSGNQEQQLKELATEQGCHASVNFQGLVEHDDIADVYQSHDVFVLPSFNEGMSNTALEALASGLPLVMTGTGGADELLEDGKNGYTIGKGNVEDIVKALQQYIDSPDTVTSHGKRSRKIAESLSWQQCSQAYLNLYNQVKR